MSKIKTVICIWISLGFTGSFGACTSVGTEIREIDICPTEVRTYLDAETETAQYEAILNGLQRCADYQTIDLSFLYDSAMVYRVFCENSSNETEKFILDVDNGEIKEGWFIPGESYRCRVVAMDEAYATVETDFVNATEWSDSYADFVVKEETIKIKSAIVRNITMDEGFNYRDLGGWSTENGKKIKYGLIYRGGKTNAFSERDKEILKSYLHIKSEIDLRNASDDGGQNASILGGNCTYLKAPILQYSYIVPSFSLNGRSFDAGSPAQIKRIFEFLADEKNYPLFFHCNAGADRTGTIAFLLCGSLGVKKEDLTRDFELTTFSSAGARLRGTLQTPFEYGIMQDDASNFVAWGDMISRIETEYSSSDSNLSACIRNYLTSVCGISENTLNKIADILLL